MEGDGEDVHWAIKGVFDGSLRFNEYFNEMYEKAF